MEFASLKEDRVELDREILVKYDGERYVCREDVNHGVAILPAVEVPSEVHWYLFREGDEEEFIADLGPATSLDSDDTVRLRAIEALRAK